MKKNIVLILFVTVIIQGAYCYSETFTTRTSFTNFFKSKPENPAIKSVAKNSMQENIHSQSSTSGQKPTTIGKIIDYFNPKNSKTATKSTGDENIDFSSLINGQTEPKGNLDTQTLITENNGNGYNYQEDLDHQGLVASTKLLQNNLPQNNKIIHDETSFFNDNSFSLADSIFTDQPTGKNVPIITNTSTVNPDYLNNIDNALKKNPRSFNEIYNTLTDISDVTDNNFYISPNDKSRILNEYTVKALLLKKDITQNEITSFTQNFNNEITKATKENNVSLENLQSKIKNKFDGNTKLSEKEQSTLIQEELAKLSYANLMDIFNNNSLPEYYYQKSRDPNNPINDEDICNACISKRLQDIFPTIKTTANFTLAKQYQLREGIANISKSALALFKNLKKNAFAENQSSMSIDGRTIKTQKIPLEQKNSIFNKVYNYITQSLQALAKKLHITTTKNNTDINLTYAESLGEPTNLAQTESIGKSINLSDEESLGTSNEQTVNKIPKQSFPPSRNDQIGYDLEATLTGVDSLSTFSNSRQTSDSIQDVMSI